MKALPFTLTILTLAVDLSMINDTTINFRVGYTYFTYNDWKSWKLGISNLAENFIMLLKIFNIKTVIYRLGPYQ